MPRRYRLTWDDTPPGEDVGADTFAAINGPDAPDVVLGSLKLTLGQSLRIGGGAAPIVTITCIEE